MGWGGAGRWWGGVVWGLVGGMRASGWGCMRVWEGGRCERAEGKVARQGVGGPHTPNPKQLMGASEPRWQQAHGQARACSKRMHWQHGT